MNNYGYPYPTYTWTHNGFVLPSDRHLDYGVVSMVNFSSVQVEDFGKYFLEMRNSVGTYTAEYELIPFGEYCPINFGS